MQSNWLIYHRRKYLQFLRVFLPVTRHATPWGTTGFRTFGDNRLNPTNSSYFDLEVWKMECSTCIHEKYSFSRGNAIEKSRDIVIEQTLEVLIMNLISFIISYQSIDIWFVWVSLYVSGFLVGGTFYVQLFCLSNFSIPLCIRVYVFSISENQPNWGLVPYRNKPYWKNPHRKKVY